MLLSAQIAKKQREAAEASRVAREKSFREGTDMGGSQAAEIQRDFNAAVNARKKEEQKKKFKENWNNFWGDVGRGIVDGFSWFANTTNEGIKALVGLAVNATETIQADTERRKREEERNKALARIAEGERQREAIHQEFTALMEKEKRRAKKQSFYSATDIGGSQATKIQEEFNEVIEEEKEELAADNALLEDSIDYTVQSGDTYNGILSRYGITAINRQTIARLNKIRDMDKIYAGQILRIPRAFTSTTTPSGGGGSGGGGGSNAGGGGNGGSNGGSSTTKRQDYTQGQLLQGLDYANSLTERTIPTFTKILEKASQKTQILSEQAIASSATQIEQELTKKTKGKIPEADVKQLLQIVLDRSLTTSKNSALSALSTLGTVAEVLEGSLESKIPGTNISFGHVLLFLGGAIGAGLMLLQGNPSGVSDFINKF
jgi:nucleoid-associated protein YgaU